MSTTTRKDLKKLASQLQGGLISTQIEASVTFSASRYTPDSLLRYQTSVLFFNHDRSDNFTMWMYEFWDLDKNTEIANLALELMFTGCYDLAKENFETLMKER